MTILSAMLILLFVVCFGIAAAWVINKFFPEPMRVIAMAVTGVVLLIVLFAAFLPDVGGMQIWHR